MSLPLSFTLCLSLSFSLCPPLFLILSMKLSLSFAHSLYVSIILIHSMPFSLSFSLCPSLLSLKRTLSLFSLPCLPSFRPFSLTYTYTFSLYIYFFPSVLPIFPSHSYFLFNIHVSLSSLFIPSIFSFSFLCVNFCSYIPFLSQSSF